LLPGLPPSLQLLDNVRHRLERREERFSLGIPPHQPPQDAGEKDKSHQPPPEPRGFVGNRDFGHSRSFGGLRFLFCRWRCFESGRFRGLRGRSFGLPGLRRRGRGSLLLGLRFWNGLWLF